MKNLMESKINGFIKQHQKCSVCDCNTDTNIYEVPNIIKEQLEHKIYCVDCLIKKLKHENKNIKFYIDIHS